MLCSCQVYLTVEGFFLLGVSSAASLFLHFYGKICFAFVFVSFWSSFLRKFQIILKSKQTFYFNINAFFSYIKK